MLWLFVTCPKPCRTSNKKKKKYRGLYLIRYYSHLFAHNLVNVSRYDSIHLLKSVSLLLKISFKSDEVFFLLKKKYRDAHKPSHFANGEGEIHLAKVNRNTFAKLAKVNFLANSYLCQIVYDI